MLVIQAIFLGLLQGLTEFLPVSSSGHLIFLPKLFGWEDQGLAFDVAVHFGTLLAVVWYFRIRLWRMAKSFFVMDKALKVDFSLRGTESDSPHMDRRLAVLIIFSSLPAFIAGYFFHSFIATQARFALIVAVNLIFWGIVLALADIFERSHKNQTHSLSSLTVFDAVIIGLAQMLAILPGTSRSGITMSAGLFRHLDKQSAAEFSFLLSIPVIAGAAVFSGGKLFAGGFFGGSLLPLFLGIIGAAISGYLAIAILLKIISRWSFMPFVAYRLILGIAILIWFV